MTNAFASKLLEKHQKAPTSDEKKTKAESDEPQVVAFTIEVWRTFKHEHAD